MPVIIAGLQWKFFEGNSRSCTTLHPMTLHKAVSTYNKLSLFLYFSKFFIPDSRFMKTAAKQVNKMCFYLYRYAFPVVFHYYLAFTIWRNRARY